LKFKTNNKTAIICVTAAISMAFLWIPFGYLQNRLVMWLIKFAGSGGNSAAMYTAFVLLGLSFIYFLCMAGFLAYVLIYLLNHKEVEK